MTDAPRYPVDMVYPDRFHRETAPSWIAATMAAVGRPAPRTGGPFRYLDLGCGAGLGLALLAAAHPQAQFVGVDINPLHVERAGQFARICANLRVIGAGFDALAREPDALGEPYDFIVLHGVYSWVSPSLRAALGALVERLLAPGGVLYLHYTTHPGHSAFAGAQAMLRRVAAITPGDSGAGLARALAVTKTLEAAGASYFRAQPQVAALLAGEGENAAYLAHDLLPADWSALHVGDVIEAMAAHGCDYAGSATLIENIDLLSVPPATMPVIAALRDVKARETARDLARNQSLRRDLYCRSGALLPPDRYRDQLDRLSLVALPAIAREGDLEVQTCLGAASVDAGVVAPLRAMLRRGPATFAELRNAAGQDAGISLRALLAMIAAGEVHPGVETSQEAGAVARRLNHRLTQGRASDGWLAAPAVGSAIAVDAAGMALAGALLREPGLRGEALARGAAGHGEAPDAGAIARFERMTLPRWQTLGVVPAA